MPDSKIVTEVDYRFQNLVDEALAIETALSKLLEECIPEELYLDLARFADQLRALCQTEDSFDSVRSSKKNALHLLERLSDLERGGRNRVEYHRVIDRALITVSSITPPRILTLEERQARSDKAALQRRGFGTFEDVEDSETGLKHRLDTTPSQPMDAVKVPEPGKILVARN